MNHKPITDSLTDAALQAEIDRLVAVDPSPDFVARVRASVVNKPIRDLSWLRLTAAAIAVVAIATAFVITLSPFRSGPAPLPFVQVSVDEARALGQLLEAVENRRTGVVSAHRGDSDGPEDPLAVITIPPIEIESIPGGQSQ